MAFSDGNTLNELSEAFSERIAELKRYSLLRLEGKLAPVAASCFPDSLPQPLI